MLRVLGCITEQHDLRLVVLAGLVCLFASFTAMGLIMRAREAMTLRLVWVLGAGIVAGSGIWATHFVAMLAYQGSLPIAYDIGRTLLSVMIAITVSTLGFALTLRDRIAPIGGAIIGCAIASMHYVGMSALLMPARIEWDATYVAPSVLLGIAISMLALRIVVDAQTWRQQLVAAATFTVAICALHFTAMAAVTLVPVYAAPITEAVLAPGSLAVAVATTALLIVGIGFATAVIDRHLEGRAIKEAQRLRAHIVELEATKQKLEQTSANLATALEAADAGNRAKSSFLAAMSHELRTPLNAIIGFSSIIQGETFGQLGHPNYRAYVDDIHRSGRSLLSLINNILDLSHLDGGGLTLSEDDFDLSAVVTRLVATLDQQAQNGGVRIANTMPRRLLAHADPVRIQQALLNVMSNAIKFTPPGGTITLAALTTADGLTLTVTDTGIGMSDEDLSTALAPFGQVDGRLSRKYEGAGLGLPLAKQLIELHGGTLAIKSTPASGTSVTLTLPASRCQNALKAA
jgi:signal transduction histidine kinase